MRLEASSDGYALLRRWIEQGAPYGPAEDPTLMAFEVEPGLQADLTVLSGNIRKTPPDELTSLTVTQTWVGGRLAYLAS